MKAGLKAINRHGERAQWLRVLPAIIPEDPSLAPNIQVTGCPFLASVGIYTLSSITRPCPLKISLKKAIPTDGQIYASKICR